MRAWQRLPLRVPWTTVTMTIASISMCHAATTKIFSALCPSRPWWATAFAVAAQACLTPTGRHLRWSPLWVLSVAMTETWRCTRVRYTSVAADATSTLPGLQTPRSWHTSRLRSPEVVSWCRFDASLAIWGMAGERSTRLTGSVWEWTKRSSSPTPTITGFKWVTRTCSACAPPRLNLSFFLGVRHERNIPVWLRVPREGRGISVASTKDHGSSPVSFVASLCRSLRRLRSRGRAIQDADLLRFNKE